MSKRTQPGYINSNGMRTMRPARKGEHPPVPHPYAKPYLLRCTQCEHEQITNSCELHHARCVVCWPGGMS